MINQLCTFKAFLLILLIAINVLHRDLFFLFQMISKYCHIKKEMIEEFPGESPLTSFTQLQSPGQETATSPEEGGAETAVKWIVPDDLPIDLRVKIAVCLIHVRQLRPVEVTMEKFLQFLRPPAVHSTPGNLKTEQFISPVRLSVYALLICHETKTLFPPAEVKTAISAF